MKLEWLVTNVTAVGSLGRAERAISGFDFGLAIFLPIQYIFVVTEPLRDVRTSS